MKDRPATWAAGPEDGGSSWGLSASTALGEWRVLDPRLVATVVAAPNADPVDDRVAVLDAAGFERAIIFGSFDTTLAAMLFAATYPERTAGLVLVDPFVT